MKCDKCKFASVSNYTENDILHHRCLSHLPSEVSSAFERYEHKILHEIKSSLPSNEYYLDATIEIPKYDKGLMKGIRERPDLIIRSPLEGNNIVIVEVDESYHDDPEQRILDKEREDFFIRSLKEKNHKAKISFIRIEPFDSKTGAIVEKTKVSRRVVKTGDFDKVIKSSIHQIRKRLTRRNPGIKAISITPNNYSSLHSPRSPLVSPYSRIFPRRRSSLENELNPDFDSSYRRIKKKIDILDSARKTTPRDSRTDNKFWKTEEDKIWETEDEKWKNPENWNSSNLLSKNLAEYYHERKRSITPPRKLSLPKSSITPPRKSITPPKSLPSLPKKQSTGALFTTKQKSNIVKMLTKKQDYSNYISSITGSPYIPSSIKLYKSDPAQVYLHTIQGAVLNHSDTDILKGVEKLRKLSNTVSMTRLIANADPDLPGIYRKKSKTPDFKEIYSKKLIANRTTFAPVKSSLRNQVTPPKSRSPPRSSITPDKDLSLADKQNKYWTNVYLWKKNLEKESSKNSGFFSFLGF